MFIPLKKKKDLKKNEAAIIFCQLLKDIAILNEGVLQNLELSLAFSPSVPSVLEEPWRDSNPCGPEPLRAVQRRHRSVWPNRIWTAEFPGELQQSLKSNTALD